MEYLQELLALKEAGVSQAAQMVYHRDYLRTKNKKYRKYNPKKRLKESVQILVEYEHDITLNKYRDQLTDRAKKDPTARQIADDPSAVLAQIETGDPTAHKEYTQWLTRAYINGTENLEDIKSTIADVLDKYNTLKKRKALPPEVRDINRIKTTGELETIVGRLADKAVDKTPEDKGKTTEIYNGPKVRVIELHDLAAAQYYGRGTRWCTASKNNNMFDYYHKDGSIYVVLPKHPDQLKDSQGRDVAEKYQIHGATKQCKDIQDHSFQFKELIKKFPDLLPVFAKRPDFSHITWLHQDEESKARRAAEEAQREQDLAALIASFNAPK